MKYTGFFLLLVFFYVPIFAHAETVLRVGEGVTISADQTVDGDYYASSGPFGDTTMSGKVAEDMYVLSGVVSVDGTVGKDLSVVSGSSHIYGDVQDDVRIVSGDVTIAEHVGGDVFVIAGSLKILSNASIDGDVIFFGGTAEINGTVKGSVLGSAESFRIDAEVGKNVDVKTAKTVTLGDKANIKGFVHYASVEEVIRAQNATVAGEITQSAFTHKGTDMQTRMKDALVPLFITLFATLSLFLFFKKQLQLVVQQIHKNTVKSVVFGSLAVLVGPIAAIVLIVTVLGSLLGVIMLGSLCLLYALGFAVAGCVCGSYLAKWFTNHPKVELPWVVLGTVCLHLLLFVPVVGLVIVVGLVMMSVGGMVFSLYTSF